MKEKGKSGVARRFAGEGAQQYDHRIRTVVPGYEALHEMVHSLLQHHLEERARLLVVGSGTGTEIIHLSEDNPGWRFTGVDPSADMTSISLQRVTERGLADKVEMRTGFVHHLPLSEPYDAATLVLVMHFIPDDGQKLDLLRSISSRLKPGAPFVLADMHGDKTSDRFADFIAAWKHRQLALGILDETVEERFRHTLSNVHFVPERRILDLLSEAGFADIEPFYGALLFGGWVARRAGQPKSSAGLNG